MTWTQTYASRRPLCRSESCMHDGLLNFNNIWGWIQTMVWFVFRIQMKKNETCQTTAEAPWHHVCEAAQASKSSEGAKRWGNWQGSLPKRYHQLHKWSTWLYSFFRGSGFQSKHLYTCNFFSLTEVYDFTTVFFLILRAGLETILLPLRTPTKFSSPRGVRIDREVLPRFTGTHDEQTMARNDTRASHLDDKTKWMHNLSVCTTPNGYTKADWYTSLVLYVEYKRFYRSKTKNYRWFLQNNTIWHI